MTTVQTLPAWAEELRRRYVQGEASQFVLHGNVHDLVLYDGEFYGVSEFLGRVLLAPSKDLILQYNLSSGVRFAKRKTDVAGLDELLLQKGAEKVLPALEQVLLTRDRVAVILEYAEMIVPAGDANFSSDADRQSVIALHRWSMSSMLERSDNVVILIAENLSELNPKLVSNPRMAAVKIEMPNAAERKRLIEKLVPKFDAQWQEKLTTATAGLKGVQIKAILEPATGGTVDPAERESFIVGLLGGAPNAKERAAKLADLTKGMSQDEIRALVAPERSTAAVDDGRDEILRLIFKRKREIIERECFGLIEFVESSHDFSVVGGIDEVKDELLAIAGHIREGRTARCPMGLLFTGPMGTGKTYVAEAFANETGLTAIKFKNFRSKWVGATEGNLERILTVVQAIGQVILIIDEGDRAFGNGDGDGDGGTGSRVIGRIKEFMSDTRNRGRVLFILMTNRPDKLDVDIKRAGRLDRKIPFLYPQEPEAVEAVLVAQFKKNRIQTTVEFPRDRETTSAKLVGYSNAELEAVALLANDYAQGEIVGSEQMVNAIHDYLPSRDVEMLEYMELLAVFEASNRRMLPKKYAEMSADELQHRMMVLKSTVGNRR